MKIVTCGYLLYRRNRELHALSIIGLNCQERQKKDEQDFIFTTSCKLTKKVSTLDTMWLNNNSKDFDYERKMINHQTSANVQRELRPSFLPNNLFLYSFTMSVKLDSYFLSGSFRLAPFLYLFVTSFLCVGVSKWSWISSFVKPFANIPPSFQRFFSFCYP